jgi:outer membrane lipoprotein-sorting protein
VTTRFKRLPRWAKAGIVLTALVAAFAVLALQQGEDGGGGGPLNAIAQAAEKTRGVSGGRASIQGVVSKPGSKPTPMRGQMVFNDEDRSRTVLTVSLPNSEKRFQMNMVSDGTTVYMSSPRFGSLPDGASWIGLDLDFALEEGTESLAPAQPDAEGQLELLARASDDIHELGKEDVRGVPTTGYRGTIPVADQAERMRDLGADELAAHFESDGSPAEVEVWVDAQGLVRRMRIVQTAPQVGSDEITTTEMQMEFFDFGIDPQIDAPDASEVFDATALTEETLEDH